jgi:hypothetical protein
MFRGLKLKLQTRRPQEQRRVRRLLSEELEAVSPARSRAIIAIPPCSDTESTDNNICYVYKLSMLQLNWLGGSTSAPPRFEAAAAPELLFGLQRRQSPVLGLVMLFAEECGSVFPWKNTATKSAQHQC